MLTHATDLIKGSWRYATGVRGYLSETIDLDDARRLLKSQLDTRQDSFLRVLERGIYGNPRSPYRRLLQHAGFQFEDVREMVRSRGLEGALSTLMDAGIYVSLDEFKGRAPIRRNGLEFLASERDFDNPLLSAHYAGSTGGSRGGGSRVAIDFDFLAYESLSWRIHLEVHGLAKKPKVLWQMQPPSVIGLRAFFLSARTGQALDRWFASNQPSWNRQGVQGRAMMAYTLLASRQARRPAPRPEYCPDEAKLVHYLAEATRRDAPAAVDTLVSPAVRVCLAAEEAGADISGTAFIAAGEPYTEGKAAVLERVGATGIPSYAMQEAGGIARACGARCAPDDMHLLTEKLALLQRPMQKGPGQPVQALFYTGLLTSSPKLMLNVESGDYGVVEERDCGCLWQQMGFTTHIRDVRSYEKLTSESVTFMGSMLFELLEQTLPARFGGGPTDYQMVEEEEGGLPRVSLLVSPRVGAVDEARVLEAVFEGLSFSDWSRRMAEQWRQGGTLRVQRREPLITGAAKVLPLHVLGAPKRTAPSEGSRAAP